MTNRLATSTSPYLLQHKDNPVDWREWGDDAFIEAAERDVPVLLSVGYAACHWCHVMAHESFEDEATAAEMNRLFVNVKVDREERPDVDSVYMEAVQAMTGQGGWPMTVWMDHEARPFFAGTYFPKDRRHGMASFGEVMAAIDSAWRTNRDEVANQAAQLVEAINQPMPRSPLAEQADSGEAYRLIEAAFDQTNGGFGNAPKFPQQPVLEFLLRVHHELWATRSREMLTKTLTEMAYGGIHDQIGGGFARYSVDHRWLVPHFEKMLYDNAQLARLYLWAGIEFDSDELLDVARKTLDYMTRDLRHDDGAFFSSEDADSEGVEGKFYVWTEEELVDLLGSDAEGILHYYGVTAAGNFEGSNILHTRGLETPAGLEAAQAKLLAARSARVRPGLDDKVISSWNGLAIRAFAEAGAALGDPTYIDAAKAAAHFVMDRLVVDGTLMRSWRANQTSVPGFLDDHAAMAVGLFSLYAASGEIEWYREAMRLVGQLERFDDPDGGFFFTADDGPQLVKRPVDTTDNPLPSGSALAVEALLIASLYAGDDQLYQRAVRGLESVSTLMGRFPSMVAHHLSVHYSMADTREVAVVGEDWENLAGVYWARFQPGTVLAPSTADQPEIPLLIDRHRPGSTLAYVCQGFVCELPTSDPSVLASQLS